MRRNLIRLFILIVLLILVGMIFYFFRNNRNENELFLYGNVDVREVDIGFRVSGQVCDVLFEEGDTVCKGTLLATLDKSPYEAEVTRALFNLESVKANLVKTEKLLHRRNELIEDGGVSQEEIDEASANYSSAKANVLAQEAALQIAKDNLAYTEAYAPTDSIVLTRVRESGTVVRVADPVFTLSALSPVWIRAFIDEPYLGRICYGMDAEIYTDTENGKVYRGKVGFISPVAEFTPKTVETTRLRTDLVYRLRIYAENPDYDLKQGMPVTVKLKLNPPQEKN